MIKSYNLKACFSALKEYDWFAKESDFLEVIEWHNGEGIDIHLSSARAEQRISVTWGEWEAMLALVASISGDEVLSGTSN